MPADKRNVPGGPTRNRNKNPGTGQGSHLPHLDHSGRSTVEETLGLTVPKAESDEAVIKGRASFITAFEAMEGDAGKTGMEALVDKLWKMTSTNGNVALGLLHMYAGRPIQATENKDVGGANAAATRHTLEEITGQLEAAGVDTTLLTGDRLWETPEGDEAESDGD